MPETLDKVTMWKGQKKRGLANLKYLSLRGWVQVDRVGGNELTIFLYKGTAQHSTQPHTTAQWCHF